jgi:hypothetical protein
MLCLTSTTKRIIASATPKACGTAVLPYGVGAFLLFSSFRYRIDPDTISHLSIAQKCLRGKWTDAVNGWGRT